MNNPRYSQAGAGALISDANTAVWLLADKAIGFQVLERFPHHFACRTYFGGYRGVLVEPNKALYNKILKVRPEDKCLNLGISNGNQTEADYYMFSEANCGMNTFSKEEALSYEKDGMKIEQVVKMPLKDINELLAEHFKTAPTVLSMDVEGLDEMILNKWDFSKWQPLLICLESVVFKANGDFVKRDSMLKLMASKGYYVYADTHINTIFCHQLQYNKLVNR